MAIQMGQATPAERPKQTANREKQKEDGNLKSQKILLTWLIENEALFAQIKKYIVPEDFTKELTAQLLRFCMSSMKRERSIRQR